MVKGSHLEEHYCIASFHRVALHAGADKACAGNEAALVTEECVKSGVLIDLNCVCVDALDPDSKHTLVELDSNQLGLNSKIKGSRVVVLLMHAVIL